MLHVLSSARGVFFEGLNYFRKIGACEKQGRRVISSLKSKFQHRGGFICFLVSVLLFSPVWYGTNEVCRVEVYSVLFAVCARFILFVVVVLLVSL